MLWTWLEQRASLYIILYRSRETEWALLCGSCSTFALFWETIHQSDNKAVPMCCLQWRAQRCRIVTRTPRMPCYTHTVTLYDISSSRLWISLGWDGAELLLSDIGIIGCQAGFTLLLILVFFASWDLSPPDSKCHFVVLICLSVLMIKTVSS